MLDMKQYSEWVEGKIMTEGQARYFENVLGLVGEAGEVAEKIKKQLRDDTEVASEEIQRELGDVLFYVAALSNLYGSNLEAVAKMNLDKLNDRQKRGVLKGEGDSR
jgi:NTP pyrophosphatase (non-canonical NTP hydrolase)